MANTTFYSLDAPAGANKTGSIIRLAGGNAQALQAKSVIAEPSREVCRQVQTRAQAQFPDIRITRIDGDSHPGSVTMALIEHVQRSESAEGELLICTHMGLFNLLSRSFHEPGRWDIYVDELPNLAYARHINVPRSHGLLTEHLEVLPSTNGVYAPIKVKAGHASAVEEIARNELNDEVYALLAGMAEILQDPYWACEIAVENWHRIQTGGVEPLPAQSAAVQRGHHAAKYPFSFYAVMDWRIFDQGLRSITVSAANFTHYFCQLLWPDVEFRPHRRLERYLAYRDHRMVAPRLRLMYAHDRDGLPVSKTFNHAPSALHEGLTNLDVTFSKAREMWSDHGRLCYSCNKSDIAVAERWLPGAARLPFSPHGNNSFSTYNDIILAGAYQLDPHFKNYLMSRGVDGEAIELAVQVQNSYQALMRTSLRNPGATEPVHALVADRETAEELLRYFPGCHIGPAGQVPKVGRPDRLYYDPAAKQRAYRERKRQLRESDIEVAIADLMVRLPEVKKCDLSLLELTRCLSPEGTSDRSQADRVERESARVTRSLIDSIRGKVTTGISLFGSDARAARERPIDRMTVRPGTVTLDVYDKRVIDGLVRTMSWSGLVEELYRMSDQVMPCKEAQCVWYPAVFRHVEGADTVKGNVNVAFTSLAVFDFEDGVLTAEQVMALFPDLEMVAVPSYRATDRTRFHLVLVYSKPVTAVQHDHFVKGFRRQLKAKGYHLKKGNPRYCGLDKSKLPPCSGFYLPSRPKGLEPYLLWQRSNPIDVEAMLDRDIDVYSEPMMLESFDQPVSDFGIDDRRTRAERRFERLLEEARRPGNRALGLFNAALQGFAMETIDLLPCGEVEFRLRNATDLPRREVEHAIRQGRSKADPAKLRL